MSDSRIRYIVFRYSHHSPHSGYSRLVEYGIEEIGGEVIRVSKPLSRRIIRERLLWRLAKGTPGYDRSSMAAELKVIGQIILERNYIYHFLYGETTYHYSGLFSGYRGNHLIASFHLPPSGIRKAVEINWHLQKLSAIICLGHTQQEYFSGIVDRDRVFYIPLGVDTDYFTPPESYELRDPNLCLIVGDNYRDYPTMRGVIELVAYRYPQVKFVAVMPFRNQNLVGTHPNLVYKSGIPESELLSLYRSASLLVMPLHDAIANNAILESMACGLPQVVSDVGSIRDYVTPNGAVLVRPNNARCMADTIIELVNETRTLERMANASREQALHFTWKKVLQQYQVIYSAIK